MMPQMGTVMIPLFYNQTAALPACVTCRTEHPECLSCVPLIPKTCDPYPMTDGLSKWLIPGVWLLTTLPGAVGLSMGKCEQDRVVVIHTGTVILALTFDSV